MKHCMTRVLFSLSLVYIVYSVPAPQEEKTRDKRSLLLDNVLHNRHRWQRHHKGNVKDKRGTFDTLDLDALFNDPMFMEADADDNRETFDFSDIDFHNLPDLPDYTDYPPAEPLDKDDLSNIIPGAQGPFDFHPVDNSLDSHHQFGHTFQSSGTNSFPAYQENHIAHDIAESMLDEFMQFLKMKEMGMLDRCLETQKRG